MSFMKQTPGFGRASVLAVGLVLAFAWATTAQAQTAVYSLSGNTRAQIGGGLPLPVTFQPAPNGKVVLGPQAFVFQTAGPDPKAMTFQLNTATPIFGPVTTTAFVALFNTRVHQVKTSLVINGPLGGTAMFSAGGRSGPATLTWCPGQPLPTAVNPACTNATSATAVHGANFNASMRYQATANQFGGTSRAIVGGGASVVIRAGATLAPCKAVALGGTNPGCLGAFSLPVINPSAVGGAPFGVVNVTSPALSPGNVRWIGVLANGQVTAVGATPLGTAPKNNVIDYGAPYTTGKVTVRAPLALGGNETFYLQGSDNRVDGIGSISLVTGGLSLRSISGYNANRGWLNYEVAPFSVPSISNGGLILLGAIFLAATAWMVRRAVATA